MKKKLLFLSICLGLAAIIQTAPAANISFVGDGYVILDINNAGNVFYDINNQANDNVTPSFDTDNSTATAYTLTINIFQGQSILFGGQLQTFPSTGGTAAFLGYAIQDLTETTTYVGFSELNLPFKDNVGAGPNDRWEQLASTSGVNLTSSLAPGSYLLTVYEHGSNNGDLYNNENGTSGNNWEVRINVAAVPEPSTLALLGGASVLGASFFLRRRRKN